MYHQISIKPHVYTTEVLIATSSACGVIHAANTVIHVHVCKFDRLRPSAVTAKYELAVFDGPKLTVTVPDRLQTACP